MPKNVKKNQLFFLSERSHSYTFSFFARAICMCLIANLCLSPLVANAVTITTPSNTTVVSFDPTDKELINQSTITPNSAVALNAWIGMANSQELDIFLNDAIGTINITPNAAGSTAIGMFSSYAGANALENKGNIIVVDSNGVVKDAYGMYIENQGGAITASQQAINSGNIQVSATAANSSAYGIKIEGFSGDHTVNNSGIITILDSAFNSYGIYVNAGVGEHNISNTNKITVTSQNADATGMLFEGEGNVTMSNSGMVTVTAKNFAIGMDASSNSGMTSITNEKNGIINVTTTHGSSDLGFAAGIQTPSGNATVNNFGVINVQSPNGLATDLIAFNSVTVGTWATTLRDRSATEGKLKGNVLFSMFDGSKITFDNSKFILRAGTASQGFVMGKKYKVSDMIAVLGFDPITNDLIVTRTGDSLLDTDVDGAIVSVESEVPYLTATLTNGNNPLKATLSLEDNVNNGTTPGGNINTQSVMVVQAQMLNITRELRQLTFNNVETNLLGAAEGSSVAAGTDTNGIAAGSSMEDNKWLVFLTPYANFVNNTEYDFSGNNMGITAGASYKVNDKFSIGAHFDLNFSTYNADVLDMNTNSTSFAFGLHSTYNILPEWYVSGQITGSISQIDGYYEMGSLSADNTYSGDALYLALNTGYVWQLAKGHSLTPEIGLSYLSTHISSYDIEWGGRTNLDLNYDDTYYSALYGNINLNWRSEWALQDDSSIALLAGVGLRQNLSGNEIESDLRTLGLKFSNTATEDMTTWLADVGIEYKKGDFSVSLTYDGAYGTKQTSHGGNIMFKLEF